MTAFLAPLQTEPWATRFIDVELLNGHASALLCRRLEDVRAAAASGELMATTSVALLGAAGAGKTHIFARLRRVVGGRASFVLVRPLLGAEPTPRLLLAEVMDQLRRPSFGGTLSQLESLVGGALSARARFPSAGLAEAANMSRDERAARIEAVLSALFALRPELEGIATYVRRLLELPFEHGDARTLLAAWLSGRDVEPEAARAAGLPGPLSDVDVLRALTAVAALAAAGAPLLIAFDQLENLADPSGNRVRAHGNLVAELVDQLPALTLVQLALTGEWLQHIQPALSLPQRTRVAEHTVLLDEPSADDRRALVRAWLEGLPEESRAGSFPAPLAAEEVERWCREPGMTPRLLLQACRRALEAPPRPREQTELPSAAPPPGPTPVGPPAPSPEAAPADEPRAKLSPPRARPKARGGSLDAALSRAWRSAVRDARREIREARGEGRLLDVERIAEILEVILAGDASSAIVWRRTSGGSPYLVGSLASGNARGTIVVVQGHHPRSVATALERARELTSGPLLLVRQGSFDFAPSWRDVAARVTELQRLTRTCWLGISDDVLAHGLAFASLLAASRSGELTGPSGEAVSHAALRAWSTETLGDSVDALDGEVRRVLAEWKEAQAIERASVATDAGPVADPSSGLGVAIDALLDVASARWGWSQAPIRWLRTARKQVQRVRRSP